MQPTYKFKLVPVRKNAKKFRKRLFRSIDLYNRSKVGRDSWKILEFEAKSPSGKHIGGLGGNTYWGWLYISVLWIHADYRVGGIGTELLRLAEKEAKRRGCKFAHLDSFTFQAPGFYKKHGYKVFGKLNGLPKGHSRVYLYKKL